MIINPRGMAWQAHEVLLPGSVAVLHLFEARFLVGRAVQAGISLTSC